MAYFFNQRKSTGVFVPCGNKLIEHRGEKGNGSINDVTISLGYKPEQVYVPVYKSDLTQAILCVCFEIFTRNIVFVLTSEKTTYVTDKDLRKHLGNFSVKQEFNSLRIAEVLTDGVDRCSLSAEFMAKVLKLKDISPNGVFYADRIKTYLYFTNGLLSDFQFNDGLFPWAKHLKEANPDCL